MELVTYPLNNVDYQAEDAELFHCTRNSGIYAGDDFAYSVTGADNNIVIGPGVGWIRNSRFKGKVVANQADQSLDLGLTDSVYPRIDAVVIQFDANANKTEIKVKTGTPASTPAAPEVSRTESLYELHLYHVYREAGAASFSVADITDLRMDTNYCGLMADSVTEVDTKAINVQVMALIEKLRQDILAAKDGSAYLMRDGSVPMGGNLDMGSHPIKNVAAPTEDGDAVNLGYAEENFAPAGYGLGGNVKFVNHWDDATESGFWASSSGLPNGVDGSMHHGIVYRYDGWIYQDIKRTATDATYSLTRKKMENGEWQPWEWDNPPMLPGVEYRTTKRYSGKVIYKKLINFGSLPAPGSSKFVNVDLHKNFECVGKIYSNDGQFEHQLPAFDGDGNLVAWTILYNYGISLRAKNVDLTSAYSAEVTVLYTKD